MEKIYKNLDEAEKATQRFRGEFIALVARYGFRANVLGVVVTAETEGERHEAKMMLSCNGDLRDVEACVGELSNLALALREKAAEKELYNFPEVIGE